MKTFHVASVTNGHKVVCRMIQNVLSAQGGGKIAIPNKKLRKSIIWELNNYTTFSSQHHTYKNWKPSDLKNLKNEPDLVILTVSEASNVKTLNIKSRMICIIPENKEELFNIEKNNTDSAIIVLEISNTPNTVLMIPGFEASTNPTVKGRMAKAIQLCKLKNPNLIVCSGWGGWNTLDGKQSEADTMFRQTTELKNFPVFLDSAARTTAENSICAITLIEECGVPTTFISVASWSNFFRQHLYTQCATFRKNTITQISTYPVWGEGQGSSLRAGTVGLIWANRHLKAGYKMLELGSEHPESRP